METGYAVKSGISEYGRGQSTAPAERVLTLASAMSLVDDLNKRLIEVNEQAMKIAESIGGPFPLAAMVEKVPEPPRSLVGDLNLRLEASHRKVGDLNEALAAMGRALGTL
jgi:hypothetical protein